MKARLAIILGTEERFPIIMKRTAVAFAFLALLAAAARISEAQWRRVGGPEGGWISGLATNGASLYASTKSHVLFMSGDNGASWRVVSYELPQGRIQAVHGRTLYAGDAYHDLYRSADGGNRWERFSCPCSKDARFARRLLAISGEDIYAVGYSEVYRTSDGGKTWIRIASGGWNAGQGIVALAADGGTIGVIVEAPLLKSYGDFPGSSGETGFYLSRDGGTTWKKVNISWRGNRVADLSIDGNALYVTFHKGGILMSEDEGNTWRQADSYLPEDLSINTLVIKGRDLFIGTSRGILRSADKGKSWSVVNTRLASVTIGSLVEQGGTLVAGTDRGVFLSGDEGLTWRGADHGLPENAEETHLVVVGEDIYAAIDEHGIFASRDGGKTWRPISPHWPTEYGLNWFLERSGNEFFIGNSSEIFRFVKKGAQWKTVEVSSANSAIECLAANSEKLVVGTSLDGVFVSEDDGAHWRSANKGLPSFADAECLTVIDGTLFAGTDEGLFALDEEASVWKSVGTGWPENILGWCIAARGELIVAGVLEFLGDYDDPDEDWSFGQVVFLSTDRGAHWEPAGSGFPRSVFIGALLIKGDEIFAGTAGLGVWRLPIDALIKRLP